jgi:hypothetical protein
MIYSLNSCREIPALLRPKQSELESEVHINPIIELKQLINDCQKLMMYSGVSIDAVRPKLQKIEELFLEHVKNEKAD